MCWKHQCAWVLSVRTIYYMPSIYLPTYTYPPKRLNTRKQRVWKRLFVIQVYIVSTLNGLSGPHLLQGEHYDNNFDQFQNIFLPTKMYVFIPSLRSTLNIMLHTPKHIICYVCMLVFKDEIFPPKFSAKLKHVFRKQYIISLS